MLLSSMFWLAAFRMPVDVVVVVVFGVVGGGVHDNEHDERGVRSGAGGGGVQSLRIETT